uniref:Protein EI24 homolog n=1 Tax=Kalanchoe fedtschenkoi TaxID=63787 RepID=A0A7N0RFY4_KALFE
METSAAANPTIELLKTKSKQAALLWLEGFREACCLHRVVILCHRSRPLLKRTGQCFLLNGFLFLGSIFTLKSVVIPTLQWILPDGCSQLAPEEHCGFHDVKGFYSILRQVLIQLFYLFWFYPLYIFSFILSTLWYNDIAKYGYAAQGQTSTSTSTPQPMGKKEDSTSESANQAAKPAGIGGIVIGIGEQVYSVFLLTFFFLQVYATGFVPYIGKALNFVLLAWMYSYYCFEYKWNLSEFSLDKRLAFFESNWAFFAGFGSPCVLAIFFFSPLVSYGVMAILFPMFVLTASGSEAEQVIDAQRKKWKGSELGRLPIFYLADIVSLRVLSLLSMKSQNLAAGIKLQ